MIQAHEDNLEDFSSFLQLKLFLFQTWQVQFQMREVEFDNSFLQFGTEGFGLHILQDDFEGDHLVSRSLPSADPFPTS